MTGRERALMWINSLRWPSPAHTDCCGCRFRSIATTIRDSRLMFIKGFACPCGAIVFCQTACGSWLPRLQPAEPTSFTGDVAMQRWDIYQARRTPAKLLDQRFHETNHLGGIHAVDDGLYPGF